jgi:hypothetical protein
MELGIVITTIGGAAEDGSFMMIAALVAFGQLFIVLHKPLVF